MKEDLRNVKWDIKKGYGVYHSVYTPQLISWIQSGQIKKGEVVVWRSGFSAFRPPEQLEDLAGFFKSYRRRRMRGSATRKGFEKRRNAGNKKRIVRKILIIDDEEKICWLLSDILKGQGYEVGVAYSARQGIVWGRRLKPDLIFLDLRLPDRTGLDLLKPLTQLPGHPVICIISAYGNEEIRRAARQNGAIKFIDKPFTAQKIQHFIKSLAP